MDPIAIIGTGRLARALARTYPERVRFVHGRVAREAGDVASLATSATPISLGDISALDRGTLWIATADAAIADLAQRLANVRERWEGVTVVHSAGALGASVLDVLAERGARVLAMHPNASLRGDAPIAPSTFWGVTPDTPEAVAAAREVLRPLEPHVVPVPQVLRALYHAAAAAASNFSVTLFAMAELLYEHAGIERPLARELVASYMSTSIERARADGPGATITGPIVRGDREVVDAQRHAVASAAPATTSAFDALVELTTALFLHRHETR